MKTLAHGALKADALMAGLRALRARPRSDAELAKRQTRRLSGLLRYVSVHSRYYGEMFDRLHLSPESIRSAEDLVRLPVLEKQTARTRMAEILTSGFDLETCPRRTTSGTTATPFSLPELPIERLLDACLWARGYLGCGCSPWRLQAKITLHFRLPGKPHLFQRLGFFRRAHLDVAAPVGEKIATLRRVKPCSLVCWGAALGEIVAELNRTNEQLSIPLIYTTSDVLWPHARTAAMQRMGACVTDIYGSVETGPIAWECSRHDGYHVHSDQVIVELLDDDNRPARQGRVVCTVLWRRTFPLIRYALGDTAEWAGAPCPCGSPYPLLKNLTGRVTDLVLLPDGTRINSVALRQAVREKPGVLQYQLVQDSSTRFRLRVRVDSAFTNDVEAAVLREFKNRFGNSLELRIVRVSHLNPPPGVKFTPTVLLEHLEKWKAEGRDVSVFDDAPAGPA